MKVIRTAIPDVMIIEPEVFGDERGFFFESYNQAVMREMGISGTFVQDNHSRSIRHTLRGLHYQIRQTQGKLVRVVAGEVFDVAVDVRKNSSSFGKWTGFVLSAENRRIAWLPPGFAHGFLTLSDHAEFLYKTTDLWAPQHERCILWNDRDIGIEWPLQVEPILSNKDRQGVPLKKAEVFGE